MNTSMVETLKEQVCATNLNSAANGVAVYTFFLRYVLEKHNERKHGKDAYYGQTKYLQQ